MSLPSNGCSRPEKNVFADETQFPGRLSITCTSLCTTTSGGSSRSATASDSEDAHNIAPAIPFEYPAELRVRNTFLEFPAQWLSLLDGLDTFPPARRRSRSWPGSPVHQLATRCRNGTPNMVVLAASAPVLGQEEEEEADHASSAAETPREVSAASQTKMFGSLDLPTMGSAGHCVGKCKPCAFFYTKGCTTGMSCQFCHLCTNGEKKRRQKEKWGKIQRQRQRRHRAAARNEDWPNSTEAPSLLREELG